MYKIVLSLVLTGVVLLCGASTTFAATSTSTATTTPSVPVHDPVAVETQVRAAFPDAAVMVDVARCESNFRQFTDSGSVFRGGVGGEMIGVFQFYETVHTAAALAKGFDLATLAGNIGYARVVYTESGTTPWSACVPVTTPVTTDAHTKIKIELLKQVIVLLQQLLVLKQAGM